MNQKEPYLSTSWDRFERELFDWITKNAPLKSKARKTINDGEAKLIISILLNLAAILNK